MTLDHLYALRLEQLLLRPNTSESKTGRQPSVGVDDSVTGDYSRRRIAVQGVADRARGVSVACHRRDLSVGRHPSARHEHHRLIDAVIKAVIHPAARSVFQPVFS